MPTYEYKCKNCSHLFEQFQSMKDAPLRKCPECGKNALERLIGTGAAIRAAEVLGADLAYLGTRFIATREAHAADDYKRMIVDSTATDIVYTPLFTGVHGNYLKGSVTAAGLDPANLPTADKTTMNFGSGSSAKAKAWRDIWGAGQGVGNIADVPPAGELILRMQAEYAEARARLLGA